MSAAATTPIMHALLRAISLRPQTLARLRSSSMASNYSSLQMMPVLTDNSRWLSPVCLPKRILASLRPVRMIGFVMATLGCMATDGFYYTAQTSKIYGG